MIEKENRIMKLFHLMILLKLFRGVILTQNTTMCPFADDVAGDSQCRAVVDKDFSSLCADHVSAFPSYSDFSRFLLNPNLRIKK